MMRLSPRLICFIGASGLLLQSTLAAREEKMSDAPQKIPAGKWQTLSLPRDERKVGEYLLDPKTLHTIFSSGEVELCNIYEVSRCGDTGNITIKGTECEYRPKEEENRVVFKQFDQEIVLEKVELHDYQMVEFNVFKNQLLSACRVEAGKFRACGTKSDGIQVHSQLMTKQKDHKFKYNLEKFKETTITICKNPQGKYVCMWRDDADKSTSCKWQEVETLHIRNWATESDSEMANHQILFDKKNKRTDFETEYAYPLEYIIEGTQVHVNLKKDLGGKKRFVRRDGDKIKKRFVHFFLKAHKAQTVEFMNRSTGAPADFRDYILDVCTMVLKDFTISYLQVYTLGTYVGELQGTGNSQFMELHAAEKTKGPAVFSALPPSVPMAALPPQSEEKSEVNHDDLNDQVQKQLNNLREAQPAPKPKPTLNDEIRKAFEQRGDFKEPKRNNKKKSAEPVPEWKNFKFNKVKETPKSEEDKEEEDWKKKVQKIMSAKEDGNYLRRRLYASELSL